MIQLKEYEEKLLLFFLEELKDRYSCDGCNDMDERIIDDIPREELIEINRKFLTWDEDIQSFDLNNLFVHYNNYLLIKYFIAKIKGEIR